MPGVKIDRNLFSAISEVTMKIAPSTAIPAATSAATTSLDFLLEAPKIRAPIAVKLEDYLKQNPSQLLYAGPISRAAASAGFKPGAPISFGSNLKLRPTGLMSSVTASPAAIPSSVAKAAEVASLLEAVRGPLEEFAKTHSALDTPLDILGFVAATPQAWNTMIKPGPKDKIEIILSSAQAAIWLGKIGADVLGLPHAKHTLTWTGVILKMGEQVRAVIVHKPETKETPKRASRPRH
jgi:hypothetical protein